MSRESLWMLEIDTMPLLDDDDDDDDSLDIY